MDEGRFLMDISRRILSHGLVFIIGLILIIGGIAAHKEGAMIGGLIVAAVNLQQLQKWHTKQSPGGKS
jgi:hypothetical protein